MTPAERRKPDLLNNSRKRRIAAGAGVPVQDVARQLGHSVLVCTRTYSHFIGHGQGSLDWLSIGAVPSLHSETPA